MTAAPRRRVLLVDDDAAFRKVYAGLLRDAGYEVSEAADREGARKALEGEPPEVVLLDLMLPPDGTVEVAARWTGQRPGAHCRSADDYYNQHGIGVCVVGDLGRHPPSPAQVAGLKRLVKFLCRQYAIPADHVYTHADVAPRSRCPGGRLDLAAVRAAVR